MANKEYTLNPNFEELARLEDELFGRSRGLDTPYPNSAGTPVSGSNSWNLNKELLDVKRENTALKMELDALRTLLTEQNVLTASSVSALKELKGDMDRLNDALKSKEAALKDQTLSAGPLKAEIEREKGRLAEITERLSQEASLRERLNTALQEKEATLKKMALETEKLKAEALRDREHITDLAGKHEKETSLRDHLNDTLLARAVEIEKLKAEIKLERTRSLENEERLKQEASLRARLEIAKMEAILKKEAGPQREEPHKPHEYTHALRWEPGSTLSRSDRD